MRHAAKFLALLIFARAISAATFESPTDAGIYARADVVVIATVVDTVTREAADRMIYTDALLRVEEVLKGSAPAEITVSELGGFANGRGVAVAGSAMYARGTRVLAFLRRAGSDSYFTAFMGLGKFRFARDARGDDVLVRGAAADGVWAARYADEFVDAVRMGDLDDSRIGLRISADAPLDFRPRSDAASSAYVFRGTAPAEDLPIRWPGCDVGCSITFTTNGPQSGTADSVVALENAMAAWNGHAASFVSLSTGGFNTDTSADNDDVNDIVFNGTGTLGFCDGAIGCGVVFFGPKHTFDGETWYSVVSADVVITTSTYNNQTSLDSVVAHELGHALSLRHSDQGTPSSTDALMRSTVPLTGATLRSWDQEAMAEVYGEGVPCVAPEITSTSGGGSVPFGTTATLSVTVTGSTPFTYKWYEGTAGDTTSLVGTNSTFTTPQITEPKSYWVRVSNECSSDDSETITVSPEPCEQPEITTHPASQNITTGQTATLTVSASGTDPFNYQWYQGSAGNRTKPVGTNSHTYKTPALETTTSYWVEVSNNCGAAASNVATITVGAACASPAITSQPGIVATSVGESVTLTITATGDEPLTFEWYEGFRLDVSKPIAGASSNSVTVGPFTETGTFRYWARVTNSCGSASSETIAVTVACSAPVAPPIFVPGSSLATVAHTVKWTGVVAANYTYELQEATNATFTEGLKTFVITNATSQVIDPHSEIDSDTRFYYRVRQIAGCTPEPSAYSDTASIVITRPRPQNSTEFSINVPEGVTTTFTQDYLVPGFGENATNDDRFTIAIDAPWLTVSPPSGALSAGGTTVQFTVHPSALEVGTLTATITVTRTQGAGKSWSSNSSNTSTVPFSVTLVTPVSPSPRGAEPPAGTLLIPAVTHAVLEDGRLRSDVRIANTSTQPITYELSFTPSGQSGATTGKKTTITIGPNEVKGLDDIVKAWYGGGVLGESGAGTLEIRPLGGANPLATVASSRTYASRAFGTLGQFIPAIPLDRFIGNIATDALARISLQQIANSIAYRTTVGIVEGSGQPATLLLKLIDGSGNVLQQATRSLPAYGHEEIGLVELFGDVALSDGRIEVEVTSAEGKVSAYASVLDNATQDPLLVFPEQVARETATHYVVPGVAEIDNGPSSNFHTDMRIYNGGAASVDVTLHYYPLGGGTAQRSAPFAMTIASGEVEAIDEVLPTLWNLAGTGGAVTIDAPADASLVITARTYSRDADGGTYGQFIPGVTAADTVGVNERALEILQLEQSPNYRTNLGLVEIAGRDATIELTAHKPDAKITAVALLPLAPNQFLQLGRIFELMGFSNVYNGRISVRVLSGGGRVAAYGSVVDNRTVDPTYVPAQ